MSSNQGRQGTFSEYHRSGIVWPRLSSDFTCCGNHLYFSLASHRKPFALTTKVMQLLTSASSKRLFGDPWKNLSIFLQFSFYWAKAQAATPVPSIHCMPTRFLHLASGCVLPIMRGHPGQCCASKHEISNITVVCMPITWICISAVCSMPIHTLLLHKSSSGITCTLLYDDHSAPVS